MLIETMKLEDEIWKGNIQLEVWNHFFGIDKDIELNIGTECKVEKIEKSHQNAYDYLVQNQKQLLTIILEELLQQYPAMQEMYGYEDDELEEYMPDVTSITDFKRLMSPRRIYILDVESQGMAYIGFHFNCSWDDEMDFGVMMYKERIVKMGGSDSAFLMWIAQEDKEKQCD